MKKILLAVDGSGPSADAAQLLASLPLAAGTAILVVSVVNRPWEAGNEKAYPEQHNRANRIAETAVAALQHAGVDVTIAVRHGDVSHELIQAAEEWGADLLVLGSRGLTGLEAFMLGSVAGNVAKHAHCPVLVVRTPVLRNVLLAIDESPHGQQALEFAGAFPLPEGALVKVLNVVRGELPVLDLAAVSDEHVEASLEAAEQERILSGEERVRAAARQLKALGRSSTWQVREGDPASEILAAAEADQADLIMAGARGHSLIRNLIVGSVADRLLKNAPCSVLIVR